MKTDTSTFLAQQIVRLRRRDQIRRLMQRDKTPLAILFMAAVVGTLTGLVGVAFEKAVSRVQNMRIGALVQVADHAFLLWPLAFILSALLAMVGYFWCENLRRKPAARVSRKLKVRWRSYVRCAGGACCR